MVIAAAGYPDSPRKGDEITGLAKDEDDVHVFHAGTAIKDGKVVTSGGRVLCVCALGETVESAQKRAYAEIAGISWRGEFHRHDIGWRAIEREREGAGPVR